MRTPFSEFRRSLFVFLSLFVAFKFRLFIIWRAPARDGR